MIIFFIATLGAIIFMVVHLIKGLQFLRLAESEVDQAKQLLLQPVMSYQIIDNKEESIWPHKKN